MNSTLNAHTNFPRSFIHCRAKGACLFGEWFKVVLPSVVVPMVGVIASIFYWYHFVFKLPFIFRVTVAQSLGLAIF